MPYLAHDARPSMLAQAPRLSAIRSLSPTWGSSKEPKDDDSDESSPGVQEGNGLDESLQNGSGVVIEASSMDSVIGDLSSDLFGQHPGDTSDSIAHRLVPQASSPLCFPWSISEFPPIALVSELAGRAFARKSLVCNSSFLQCATSA